MKQIAFKSDIEYKWREPLQAMVNYLSITKVYKIRKSYDSNNSRHFLGADSITVYYENLPNYIDKNPFDKYYNKLTLVIPENVSEHSMFRNNIDLLLLKTFEIVLGEWVNKDN